ncbi:hypothetical protein C5748_21980 [Phyllobacterium phragmitis]|uniref:Twin-arginine translocation signal domain-containing protein n=1 Tax=Phyllobacterium phragmitis TaxID=2670329 RepID=A0A2S9ILF8_9HYPH|nr:twin-arginine translocation signal domain-containing protein [Phyllobacterium phragmitis]PRD41360.1 hypothetical protein C5748_21980 [Phyllobacterium phragmitis]
MPNATVRGAAEGLPTLTRRLFLRNSAAAGAALAVVSAPVIADAIQQENPDLLRIGDQLAGAVEEFRTADQKLEEARAHFDAIAPVLPAELIHEGDAGSGLARYETDCEGKEVCRGSSKYVPRRTYSAALIEKFHGPEFGKTRLYDRKMKRLYEISATYEKGIQAAKEAAGIESARLRREMAAERLRGLADAAAELVPHSLTGIVIKARAFDALGQCSGIYSSYAIGCARRLPTDVIAVFGSEVQS